VDAGHRPVGHRLGVEHGQRRLVGGAVVEEASSQPSPSPASVAVGHEERLAGALHRPRLPPVVRPERTSRWLIPANSKPYGPSLSMGGEPAVADRPARAPAVDGGQVHVDVGQRLLAEAQPPARRIEPPLGQVRRHQVALGPEGRRTACGSAAPRRRRRGGR
jgi:hypothetical protein